MTNESCSLTLLGSKTLISAIRKCWEPSRTFYGNCRWKRTRSPGKTNVNLVSRDGQELAGVIYIHRISDSRFGGSAVEYLRMFRKLCGDGALKNVALVTSMWGDVGKEGRAREKQLRRKYLKHVIKKGARLYRYEDTRESAEKILEKILKKKPVLLQIQQELASGREDVVPTEAEAAPNKGNRAANRPRFRFGRGEERRNKEVRNVGSLVPSRRSGSGSVGSIQIDPSVNRSFPKRLVNLVRRGPVTVTPS
jgi:hypothetical protein